MKSFLILAVLITGVALFGVSSNASAGAGEGLAAGAAHTCAITPVGGLRCWGYNAFGQLGDGTLTNRTAPVDVAFLDRNVISVDAGAAHTCALLRDTVVGSKVKCWGFNYWGQLGNGSSTGPQLCSGSPCSTTPVEVIGLTDPVSIAAGGFHTCAVTRLGALKCWGENVYGQLGTGVLSSRSATPVDVPGLESGVVSVTAGLYHTCAVLTSGAVKCWGYNNYGKLGGGSFDETASPLDVSGLSSGAAAVASSGYFTCSLMSNGDVKCWGDNYAGQLADGTTIDRASPVLSNLGSAASALRIGAYHACGELAGALKCWGQNARGQLGDGTTSNSVSPVSITGFGSGVVASAAGGLHTCGQVTGQLLHCWGRNVEGQLGDGTLFDRLTPVSVGITAATDRCPDSKELGPNPTQGGLRDPMNPWDYFEPTHNGQNRVNDIIAVVNQYFIDAGSPDYNPDMDRTAIAGGDPWDAGPPNGQQRVDDILAVVKQYFHDCA